MLRMYSVLHQRCIWNWEGHCVVRLCSTGAAGTIKIHLSIADALIVSINKWAGWWKYNEEVNQTLLAVFRFRFYVYSVAHSPSFSYLKPKVNQPLLKLYTRIVCMVVQIRWTRLQLYANKKPTHGLVIWNNVCPTSCLGTPLIFIYHKCAVSISFTFLGHICYKDWWVSCWENI